MSDKLSSKRDSPIRVTGIFGFEKRTKLDLPLFVTGISAGFPSPADDYIDRKLDLNELLITHPAATFFVRVEGNSMINAGIHSGDILVVDRALESNNNNIVLAILDGEFTVKRIKKLKNDLYLMPENPDFEPIKIDEETNFEVWGVVTYVVHSL